MRLSGPEWTSCVSKWARDKEETRSEPQGTLEGRALSPLARTTCAKRTLMCKLVLVGNLGDSLILRISLPPGRMYSNCRERDVDAALRRLKTGEVVRLGETTLKMLVEQCRRLQVGLCVPCYISNRT